MSPRRSLRLSESSVVSIKNKSFSVTANIDVPASGAEGVIIAQGGRFGGWCVYAKHGKATFVYNVLGIQEFATEAEERVVGALMTEHYAGNDTNVRTLAAGILAAYAGISVEDFEKESDAFLRSAMHPSLGRGYLECAYAPMVELLGYLKANGFTNYIASGGGRDFMRPVSQDMYGIPRERVIGSSTTFAYSSDGPGGTITHKPEADYLDDGPEKPVRIWNRTGRRPLLAAGNSNGDAAMLEFTHHADKPTLRLLILHDDSEREFDYTTGAEQALKQAKTAGWTVISMKNDWATVF
jgi:phosphoserine phosphatase